MLKSVGHWFESGNREIILNIIYYLLLFIIIIIMSAKQLIHLSYHYIYLIFQYPQYF